MIYIEIHLQNLGGLRILLAEFLMGLHYEQVEQVLSLPRNTPTRFYRNRSHFRAFDFVAGAWGG